MAIILASSSPTRFNLLKTIVKDFKVISPHVDEESIVLSTERLPGELSKLKAYAVFSKYPNDIVIAADTVVVLNNQAISKPSSLDNAVQMILSMQGKTYPLLTGVTILAPHFEWTKTIKTILTMKTLTVEIITNYVDQFKPLDKAGGYAGDDNQEAFYERVEGSLTNTYGLPIEIIQPILERLTNKILLNT
jgi:septum formation protein